MKKDIYIVIYVLCDVFRIHHYYYYIFILQWLRLSVLKKTIDAIIYSFFYRIFNKRSDFVDTTGIERCPTSYGVLPWWRMAMWVWD